MVWRAHLCLPGSSPDAGAAAGHRRGGSAGGSEGRSGSPCGEALPRRHRLRGSQVRGRRAHQQPRLGEKSREAEHPTGSTCIPWSTCRMAQSAMALLADAAATLPAVAPWLPAASTASSRTCMSSHLRDTFVVLPRPFTPQVVGGAACWHGAGSGGRRHGPGAALQHRAAGDGRRREGRREDRRPCAAHLARGGQSATPNCMYSRAPGFVLLHFLFWRVLVILL